MNMPISSISAGLTPTREFSGIQVRSEKSRADTKAIIASLPGNNDQADSKPQNIRRVAADIAKVSQTFNKKLQFIVDQQSNEVIVKVIDKTTDKVIKVLPPEELQRLHRKLKEAIGFLFNEQV
jgi:flagellar protein FlaG